MVEIREYDRARDHDAVRNLCVELQDFEREILPGMPPGAQIVDAYLKLMFARCQEFAGEILVAEIDGVVAGYVGVWTKYRSTEPDDDPRERGFIPDLAVSSDQRGHGIGRALLRAAEERAREAGATSLELSVLAANANAHALYRSENFVETEIHLEKQLSTSNGQGLHDNVDPKAG